MSLVMIGLAGVAAAAAADARSMPTRALDAKTLCVSNIAHIFMWCASLSFSSASVQVEKKKEEGGGYEQSADGGKQARSAGSQAGRKANRAFLLSGLTGGI